jgi:teichuronic acid biosynthesis glycosyltransferase TuaH
MRRVTARARSYVVYGSIPWETSWLTDQNLATALGRRARVLYIEPAITPLTPFRYGPRSNTAQGLRTLLRRRPRRVGATVHAFRPLALPPREHPRARAMSAPLVRAQVRNVVRRLGLERPVAIAASRSMIPLADAADEIFRIFLVKDWIQAGGSLLGRDPAEMALERDAMCAFADLICATSPELQRALASRGFQSALLPHGFHADLAERYDSAALPPEYESLPRPLLGYAGRIDGRLDFSVLERLADRFASGSLLLIGPRSPRLAGSELASLGERANVHLVGERSRDDLPAYLTHLDCGLMPYRETEWLRYASPLKLWDYLYAGPPIVASGCPALEQYPLPLVRLVRPQTFVTAVEEAISTGDAGRDERRAVALANSWDSRADELEALIARALGATDGR